MQYLVIKICQKGVHTMNQLLFKCVHADSISIFLFIIGAYSVEA
ncbi:DUF916 and DUF3324 domain-containing protein, partial [Enterococcus faecalis]